MIDLETESKVISDLTSRLNLAQQTVEREQKELGKLEAHLEDAQDAQEILQHLAQAVQQKAHERIAEVVSSCLSSVFDNPYTFSIAFERKRGRTEAYLRFLRGGLEVEPLKSSGGGTIDIASFALRVSSLVLHRPRLSSILVMDEPFRFLSLEYQSKAKQMLEQLADEMGLQIIMVTHNERFITGQIISL